MMLYTGVALFTTSTIFSEERLTNFLYLLCSMRTLLDDARSSDLAKVKEMLKNFIETSVNIYGEAMVAYNVHS